MNKAQLRNTERKAWTHNRRKSFKKFGLGVGRPILEQPRYSRKHKRTIIKQYRPARTLPDTKVDMQFVRNVIPANLYKPERKLDSRADFYRATGRANKLLLSHHRGCVGNLMKKV